MQIWDVHSGAQLFSYSYEDFVDAVAWSPDGTQIASASVDVRVWQAS